jgi:hypothetical protein
MLLALMLCWTHAPSLDVMLDTCSSLQYTSWCNITLFCILCLFKPIFNTCTVMRFPRPLHLKKIVFIFCWFFDYLNILQVFYHWTKPCWTGSVDHSVAHSMALKTLFISSTEVNITSDGDAHEWWMGKNLKGSMCALTKWPSWYFP